MAGEKEIIGVVGAGAMGRGIAQIAAVGGFPVVIWDANGKVAEEAKTFIADMLNRAAEKGRMAKDAAAAAIARITVAGDLQGFAPCTIIIEAIVERLDIKQKLFADLEAIVAETTILATNTSSLSVTAIAAGCQRPERVAGYHFFNPVPLMKVVEVIDAVRTAPWVSPRLVALAHAMGHKPVKAQDTPGFLVNHAGRAYNTEAFRMLGEGIADPCVIDDILREAVGFRMGPFELMDLTGLDVSHAVMESVYTQFYDEPKYRPSALAAARVSAKLFGRKTGEGFYRYEKGEQIRPAAMPAPDARPQAVWLNLAAENVRRLVSDLASRAGVAVENGDKPSSDAIAVLTPLGGDATTTAVERGLDATRTVAIDPLFGLEKRRTLMTTSVTSPAARDAMHGLLASDGVAVSVIHDSPGFVAQRVVAMIVNIASDIAQQRIATSEDIEAAVKLGLGYPKGPLEFGDALGAPTVLQILEAMHSFYGDPRYRPSPWLKRRAKLGVSLMTAEA